MIKLVEKMIALTLVSIILLALFIVGKRIYTNNKKTLLGSISYSLESSNYSTTTRIKVGVGLLICSGLLLIILVALHLNNYIKIFVQFKMLIMIVDPYIGANFDKDERTKGFKRWN